MLMIGEKNSVPPPDDGKSVSWRKGIGQSPLNVSFDMLLARDGLNWSEYPTDVYESGKWSECAEYKKKAKECLKKARSNPPIKDYENPGMSIDVDSTNGCSHTVMYAGKVGAQAIVALADCRIGSKTLRCRTYSRRKIPSCGWYGAYTYTVYWQNALRLRDRTNSNLR